MSRLSAQQIDEILARRRACAEAAMKGRAHRALPLSVVEARQHANRKPWPRCSGDCAQGDKPCTCPTAGASAVSGIEDEPPYNTRPARQKPTPMHPTYTVAAVVALALLCFVQWVRA